MIASFIHEVSGDGSSLSDDDNLRHGMLTSSLCHDVMTPIGMLLWAEVMFPGADVGAVAKRTLERLEQHCRALDQSLGEWRWLDKARNRRVMLVDCLLWEELNVARQVFGPRLSLAATPMLARFYDEFPAAAICEALLADQPVPDHGAARRGRRHREDPAASRLKRRISAGPTARRPSRRAWR